MSDPVVVAEIERSGFVEGHHHGSVVALDPDGSVAWGVGDVDSPILPRSSNKPVQALGMLHAGLDLDGELLAMACASHSGEAFHLEAVREILAGAGLDEAALQTPPDFPLDDEEKENLLRAGGSRTPIQMNCSGKHAAMLATCVANGWDTSTYLLLDHPLQVQILETFTQATGEPVETVATDGCGAPLLSASLVGLARAFRTLSLASSGPERRIADAIRQHPEHVSGNRRDEARLLAAIPGAIAKAGAEAVYAVGLPDGRAVALKIDDGGTRARPVVMAEALRRMGVLGIEGVDADAVVRTGDAPLWGGGRRVGQIRVAF
jgi:L-asparaginase II